MKKMFPPIYILITAGLTAIIILIMHLTEPNFNPIFNYLSEYALGKYGILASLAFSVYGFCAILLSSAISNKQAKKYLLIAGLSLIIVGFFHCDPKRAQLTVRGAVHLIFSAFTFTGFILGFLALSNKMKNSILSFLLWTGIMILPLFVMGIIGDFSYAYHFFVPQLFLRLSDIVGLLERILFFISLVWIFALANTKEL